MRNSIKAKIIVGLLLTVIVATAVIFGVTALNISRQSREAALDAARREIRQADNAMTLFIDESRRNTVMMSLFPAALRAEEVTTTMLGRDKPEDLLPDGDDAVGKDMVAFLDAIRDSHKQYVDVYLGTEKGAYVIGKASTMPANYDPRVRPWYKDAKAAPDKAVLSSAYMSTNGLATISVAKAVRSGGRIVGVVAADISLGDLTDMVKKIRLGKDGYVILLQGDGTVLADPHDDKTLFKNVSELPNKNYARLAALKSGDATADMNGERYAATVYTSPALGWKFIGLVRESEIMAPVSRVLLQNLLVFTLCLLGIAAVIWLFIERSVARPLRTVIGFLDGIGSGNYSDRVDHKRGDEIGAIFNALNDTARKLGDNIHEITAKSAEAQDKARTAEEATQRANEALAQARQARSDGMLEAARRLETAVGSLSSTSDEIMQRSQHIRSGTQTQRERIRETATAMEEMNSTVLEVARNAGTAAEHGVRTRDEALQGANVVEDSIKAMAATSRRTEVLNRDMAQLEEQAQAIGSVMTVITDIADQTNLLALNAAIEAARAGDAGRGFAVVADEVRKLAEKTMAATKEVGDTIVAIQRVARENISAMGLAVSELGKASELANRSGEVLHGIVSGTDESAGQIQSIATAADQQSAASEEITRAVDEINRIADDTYETVEDTARAADELKALSARLSELVRSLQDEARAN